MPDEDTTTTQPTGSDGRQLVRAKNGALRDPQTGRIVATPPGGLTTSINPSNAYEYHEKARRKRLAVVYGGMIDGVMDKRKLNTVSARQAARELAKTQALVALDPKNRNVTRAYQVLMRQADLLPERAAALPPGVGAQLNVSDGIMRELVDMARAELERRRTDGE